MPEMPNVVMNETIESEWGNDIRDRTIQRYTDTTERSALHAAPAAGDMSYLDSTGLVYVYTAGAWRFLGGPESLEGHGTPGSAGTTTSFTSLKSFSITIPTYWDEWSCLAQACWTRRTSAGANTVGQFRLQVDGVDGEAITLDTSASSVSSALLFRVTNRATTGSRAIHLMGRHTGATAVTCENIYVVARATRTA